MKTLNIEIPRRNSNFPQLSVTLVTLIKTCLLFPANMIKMKQNLQANKLCLKGNRVMIFFSLGFGLGFPYYPS